MSLFLASAALDALPAFLAEVGAGPRAVFVPTAANGLPDRDELVRAIRLPLVEAGLDISEMDLGGLDRVALPTADLIVVSAGDPFSLLARIRRTGFDAEVRQAIAGGATYVGISAGAVVAGPMLEPVVLTSPFAPAPGANLKGIGLTDRLVLPHADRPGRTERNALALGRYGREVSLVPLSDDEALVVTAGRAEVRNAALGCVVRDAEVADAAGVADTTVEAGRVGWASFLGTDRLTLMEPRIDLWAERVAAVEPPARLLVASDVTGVVGFVWAHAAVDVISPRGSVRLTASTSGRGRGGGESGARCSSARSPGWSPQATGVRCCGRRSATPDRGGCTSARVGGRTARCETRSSSASACANSATVVRS